MDNVTKLTSEGQGQKSLHTSAFYGQYPKYSRNHSLEKPIALLKDLNPFHISKPLVWS